MENEKKLSVPIIVAIIGALALIAVPVVGRLIDIYLPIPTPTPASSNLPNTSIPTPETDPDVSKTAQITPFTINDLTNDIEFKFDKYDLTATPECSGAFLWTGESTIVDYQIHVPQAWTVIIDSFKAEWDSGNYQNNGILIIIGEWQGVIHIDTGAICAVPSDQLQSNLQTRRSFSGNDGRPEFIIP